MRTRKFAFEIYWPLLCALITVFDSKRVSKELLWCLWNHLTVQKVNKGDRLSFSKREEKGDKKKKTTTTKFSTLPISFIQRVSTQFYLFSIPSRGHSTTTWTRRGGGGVIQKSTLVHPGGGALNVHVDQNLGILGSILYQCALGWVVRKKWNKKG